MLNVSRRDGESVLIGPDIIVTVKRTHGDTGRAVLGIDAPPDVLILLQEKLRPGQVIGPREKADQSELDYIEYIQRSILLSLYGLKNKLSKLEDDGQDAIFSEIRSRIMMPLSVRMVPASSCETNQQSYDTERYQENIEVA